MTQNTARAIDLYKDAVDTAKQVQALLGDDSKSRKLRDSLSFNPTILGYDFNSVSPGGAAGEAMLSAIRNEWADFVKKVVAEHRDIVERRRLMLLESLAVEQKAEEVARLRVEQTTAVPT